MDERWDKKYRPGVIKSFALNNQIILPKIRQNNRRGEVGKEIWILVLLLTTETQRKDAKHGDHLILCILLDEEREVPGCYHEDVGCLLC